MQILKLCSFGKTCKRNLIKFRETEIQRHADKLRIKNLEEHLY